MTKAFSVGTLLLCFGSYSLATRLPRTQGDYRKLLLLDVDSTLYHEADAGIESQIVANTHRFCQERLGMSKAQADDLFQMYGSTIEGLKRTLWQDLDAETTGKLLSLFYQEVYQDIDMSSLLNFSRQPVQGSTGYSHSEQELRLIRQLLKACPYPVAVASNSPSWHVEKVLKCLGLYGLSFEKILTPDSIKIEREQYPTKHQAKNFFEEKWMKSFHDIAFFDDSRSNLGRVTTEWRNVEPFHVGHNEHSLSDALFQNLGLVDADFEFDAAKYLECKNRVDSKSIQADTWNLAISQIQDRMHRQGNLSIVDIGAGRLNILSLLIQGEPSRGLNPLVTQPGADNSIEYIAYEANAELLPACQAHLQSLGFRLIECPSGDEFIYSKSNWNVRLLIRDFDDKQGADSRDAPPDWIIGCCFADLLDPGVMVPSLLRSFGLLESSSRSTLIYFPITFTGQTQFLPPSPFEDQDSSSQLIPSDTYAFQIYSRELSMTQGHNIDSFLLEEVMLDFGATLVSKGASNWNIDPATDQYLADTMMFFFGRTAGPSLMHQGLDAAAWIRRAKLKRPRILVSNIDFLFEVGSLHAKDASDSAKADKEKEGQEISHLEQIEFVAPEDVTTVRKAIPELGPNEVLIESVCSLISSGTELKIFKGNFDSATLDVNIAGMKDEQMAYPLSYGYSLVGRIVKCGSHVPSEDYLGRLAFAFAPHASHVVSAVSSLHLVPHGISPRDAVFMPSVETALSLVHDAHVRVGENVAIFGQGLIGLLVTAILRLYQCHSTCPGKYWTITTFDAIPDRLAASSMMGATQALLPGVMCGTFDVTIEVSGNARALQSAIDSTANGGRIIVGSWYGSGDVSLKLGIDFHRSHKTIRTSQVSEIPAEASGLWDKTRRFGLAWALVRDLRPSRLLTKAVSLGDAQDAYRALDDGTELAVAFDYQLSHR